MGASNYYGNSATTNNMQIMTSKILVTIDSSLDYSNKFL